MRSKSSFLLKEVLGLDFLICPPRKVALIVQPSNSEEKALLDKIAQSIKAVVDIYPEPPSHLEDYFFVVSFGCSWKVDLSAYYETCSLQDLISHKNSLQYKKELWALIRSKNQNIG